MEAPPRISIAYHEAGHAVAALLTCCRVHGLQIQVAGDSAGLAFMHDRDHAELTPAQRGVIDMSGVVAQSLAARLGYGNVSDQDWSSDLEHAGNEVGDTFIECHEKACSLMVENWELVQALANRLNEEGSLTEQEIIQICEGL